MDEFNAENTTDSIMVLSLISAAAGYAFAGAHFLTLFLYAIGMACATLQLMTATGDHFFGRYVRPIRLAVYGISIAGGLYLAVTTPDWLQLASFGAFGIGIVLFHVIGHRVIGAKRRRYRRRHNLD